MFRRHLAFALLVAVACAAPGEVRAKGLAISENRRFLVHADGRPFFWLGDTAWELFHRLDREQAERYLRDRSAHGYTVIQAVVLAELDGLRTPNPYGRTPLENEDPARPSEAYFEHVDWIVHKANQLGLVMAMLPTWGDKWNKKWGIGPEIFTAENAEGYGRWLGARYRNADLVWILGGDRPIESDTQKEIIRAMARGLRVGDGGAHLMTFHPTGCRGSAESFHEDDWLDFNMRQNGHVAEHGGCYEKIHGDYHRQPTKPVLDGEPLYEDHPISFQAAKLGHSVAIDVRRPLYWGLFSGAFGHSYGHHSVWQFWTPERKPINDPLMPWDAALAQPGARHMQHARWLLESRPFLTRVPDDSLVVADRVKTAVPGAGRYRFVATRDEQGRYAMVYVPVGRAFSVRMDAIKGHRVKAWWFDPRTGQARSAGSFPATGQRSFTPPHPGEALDWILVLDDAAQRYPPPGSRKRSRPRPGLD